MMEFLNHISTQRGKSHYDGVPKSYLYTERDKRNSIIIACPSLCGDMIKELHHNRLSLSVVPFVFYFVIYKTGKIMDKT
jgi:hypothetical protein